MSRSPANKTTVDRSDDSDLWQAWFEESPIAMRIEDWSEVKQVIGRLRTPGSERVTEPLAAHPGGLLGWAPAAKVLDANLAAIRLYNAVRPM